MRWTLSIGFVALFIFPSIVLAKTTMPRCELVHAVAQIAKARSPKAIAEAKAKVTGGYLIDLVAVYRGFELRPESRAAASALLKQIPSNNAEQEVILGLNSRMCESEPIRDIDTLAGVQSGLPRLLARAVERTPAYMAAYVSYAIMAVGDPDSDYTVRMQGVCRDLHSKFIEAVEGLKKSDQEWFVKDIFDPSLCRAIHVPESD